jgi:hypothetical protein
MPYVEHPDFTPPQNARQTLWRYMDLAKYLHFVKSHTLFFCRTDKFEDQFEGALPRPNVESRRRQLDPIRAAVSVLQQSARQLWNLNLSEADARRWAEESAEFMEQYMVGESMLFRRFTFVNCWHIGDYESAAMWKLYTHAPESVAIKSSFERLVNAFANAPDEIYVGGVRYTDYERETVPEGNEFQRFFTKRKSFEHERELRAMIREWPPLAMRADGTQYQDLSIEPPFLGKTIPVDVTALVEEVVASPLAADWFVDLVAEITFPDEQAFRVRPSELLRQPLF